MTDEKSEDFYLPIKLIVGLGNPGSEYSGNRHNIGFMLIDELASRTGVAFKRKSKSDLSQFSVRKREIFLQKPVTYMNCSGDAVKNLCRREKIKPAEVLVVYDDLDLKPGRIRIRFGGGSGGHNGIKSITARFGMPDYGRLKMGIGRPDSVAAVADYVLSDFADNEAEMIEKVVSVTADAVLMLCNEGYEAAMNTYNGSVIEEYSEQPNQE
jgi:peptidyl-tRNA hydrolase, PTH1 family